ncbi:hypothetical protein PVAP13_5NG458640 [Panicum virgatum]|uniref:Uncharacterized protein n=1 Tax=Panicum virgatum TaxID=38727 RepID=A0A8T0S261_PANVG|nr:hypothetical protein PVAP13_5NG458640 [Panicum virgatum]
MDLGKADREQTACVRTGPAGRHCAFPAPAVRSRADAAAGHWRTARRIGFCWQARQVPSNQTRCRSPAASPSTPRAAAWCCWGPGRLARSALASGAEAGDYRCAEPQSMPSYSFFSWLRLRRQDGHATSGATIYVLVLLLQSYSANYSLMGVALRRTPSDRRCADATRRLASGFCRSSTR